MSSGSSSFKTISYDGLWGNNVAFAQQLALCPLLAVTTSATNGLGMGLSTAAVMMLSNGAVSAARKLITPEIRIPAFIVLIAAIVTVADMLINAYMHDLYKVLGLFIPLIVTNCVVLGRAESFAFHNPVLPSMLDGLMMGLGFTWALTLMGACREIIGSGTLFAYASLLLGDAFKFLEMVIIHDYHGYLLMILPPGGFLMMGFLLAGKRLIDARLERAAHSASLVQIQGHA
ncbi:MAG: electron transport complex subunit E [Thiotrichaceae bacterium]|nr:electron transport complex subunit E [Thiotrichaceae bacterium]